MNEITIENSGYEAWYRLVMYMLNIDNKLTFIEVKKYVLN